jgi:hypothetical protein
MISKVFIYHPSKYLGGTEVLFSRVAILLKDQLGCQVTIVGYNESCAVKRALGVRWRDFNYIDCARSDWYSELNGCALISSAKNIVRFNSINFAPNVRFRSIFWLVHPAELYSQIGVGYDRVKKILGYKFLRFFYRLNPFSFPFESLLKELDSCGSLYFMDRSVLRESEWVMIRRFVNPRFLYLTSGLISRECKVPRGENCVLLSRLDSFKISGINRLLTDLESSQKSGGWSGNLTIIGDGDGLELLRERARKLSFTVEFAGYIPSDKIRDYLLEGGFAVFFGMGMSLLEGASIGIPCIMLPASDTDINDERCYISLNVEDGGLGEYFYSPSRSAGYVALPELLQDIFCNADAYKEKSLLFFEKFYSYDASVNGLKNALVGQDGRPESRALISLLNGIVSKCREALGQDE